MFWWTASALANPAPCEPPPQREVLIEVTSREAHPRDPDALSEPVLHRVATVSLDLDGDGVLDAAVPTVAPRACPHEVQWTLYRMHAGCPVDVGTVVGFPQVVGTTAGMRNVQTEQRLAEITDRDKPPGPSNVATLHEVTTTWTFSGDAYRQTSSDHHTGLCHHCGMPSCVTVPAPK